MNVHQNWLNCNWNQKQISQNNHLQTLFQNHSYILSNCNLFPWPFIEIRSKLVKAFTSKHYFTLIPIFYWIGDMYVKIQSHSFLYSVNLEIFTSKSNHTHSYTLSTWRNVLQNSITSKHSLTLSKPNLRSVWESVREKKGRASFQNSMNGHFSGSGLCQLFSM